MPNTMQLIQDLSQWRAFRNTCPNGQSIGFVPTMGVLHKGHVSLMKTSQQENDLTVVSLFVNQTQFNNPDDFARYPRPLEADLEVLQHEGVDVCLLPNHDAIYKDDYRFRITENKETQRMEGLVRPGHFTGVLTVVMKLLQLVRPARVYFGEKDYQQFRIIHDMVDAFFMNIEVKACPTIREPSQLPYSSRNQRLTPEQYALAEQFAQVFHQRASVDSILAQLSALGIRVDYVEEHEGRRFAAVHIGEIRLIDNYALRTT